MFVPNQVDASAITCEKLHKIYETLTHSRFWKKLYWYHSM